MRTGLKVTIADVTIITRRRKSEKRKISYYYAIKDPLTGKYSDSKKSVSQLAKDMGTPFTGKMNKSDARLIVAQAIEKGFLHFPMTHEPEPEDSEQLLIPYVEKICDYNLSPWVKAEAQRKGRSHSKKYLDKMLRGFQIHAKPLLPKDMLLKAFTKKEALALMDKMYSNGSSPDSINAAMEALKTAFNYAETTGLIDYNPMIGIKKFSVERDERIILTKAEARTVLDILQKHSHEAISRYATYLASKLAIYAGMRLSEIRAFSLSMLSSVINDNGEETAYMKIAIEWSWDDSLKKIGPTKGRYKRATVIPKGLAEELMGFGEETGRVGETMLFRACRDTHNKPVTVNTPMSKSTFEDLLYEAFEEMGIDEEERKRRGLDFHSLRHFYDSEIKSVAAKMKRYKEVIRDAVGHKSESVDELIYTHDTATSLIMTGVMSEHILDILGADND